MATSAQIRQQLVEALQLDLIGPTTEHRGRLEERLPQPPSIWYITGFLVPNAFQEEAGRPAEGDQASSADLAGEEPATTPPSARNEEKTRMTPTTAREIPPASATGFPPPPASA